MKQYKDTDYFVHKGQVYKIMKPQPRGYLLTTKEGRAWKTMEEIKKNK